ncbi:hypothetical protein A3F66_05650 [candidate division TM6 bacterium RIFCSPHIGHO2_12_FULL_32_22]|nr:MAG: hypothetical protein A3F66_05650 [candidate division TM6 bacterium RIFCSPHIGHO2_12_FULL_32_22]
MKRVIILGLVAMGAIEAAPNTKVAGGAIHKVIAAGATQAAPKIIDMYRIPKRTKIKENLHECEIRATDCSLVGYFYTGNLDDLKSPQFKPKPGLYKCNLIKLGIHMGVAVYANKAIDCSPYIRQYARDMSGFDFYHYEILKSHAEVHGANSHFKRELSEILKTYHEGCPAQQEAGPAE